MENQQDNIGLLFKKQLGNLEQHASIEEWQELEIKYSGKKFFKFHLQQFNLYYAIAILLSVVLSASVATDYLLNKNKIAAIAKNIEIQTNVKENAAATQNSKPIVPAEIVTNHASNNIKLSNNRPTKVAKSTISKKKNVPISPIISADTVTATSSDEILKKANKIYIIKQDTIIRYDSIKVKRSGKKNAK